MVPAMVLSTLGWFAWRLRGGVPFALASTEAFTILAVCQWFNALNCRSDDESVARLGLVRDKWLLLGIGAGILLHAGALYTTVGNRLLHTTPLSGPTLVRVVLVAGLVLAIEEARKGIGRLRRARGRTERGGEPVVVAT